MNRIVQIALAITVGAGMTAAASAQGRHDEKPHGYDAKAAAERAANAAQERYVVLPSGPRGHDNPLRSKKIAIAPRYGEQPATTSSPDADRRK